MIRINCRECGNPIVIKNGQFTAYCTKCGAKHVVPNYGVAAPKTEDLMNGSDPDPVAEEAAEKKQSVAAAAVDLNPEPENAAERIIPEEIPAADAEPKTAVPDAEPETAISDPEPESIPEIEDNAESLPEGEPEPETKSADEAEAELNPADAAEPAVPDLEPADEAEYGPESEPEEEAESGYPEYSEDQKEDSAEEYAERSAEEPTEELAQQPAEKKHGIVPVIIGLAMLLALITIGYSVWHIVGHRRNPADFTVHPEQTTGHLDMEPSIGGTDTAGAESTAEAAEITETAENAATAEGAGAPENSETADITESVDSSAEGSAPETLAENSASAAQEEAAETLADLTGIVFDGKWLNTDGGKKYELANGDHVVGWIEIDPENRYCPDVTQKADAGFKGEYYYFDENGMMLTGWQEIGGLKYYLDPESGAMLHDTIVDGITLGPDGDAQE